MILDPPQSLAKSFDHQKSTRRQSLLVSSAESLQTFPFPQTFLWLCLLYEIISQKVPKEQIYLRISHLILKGLNGEIQRGFCTVKVKLDLEEKTSLILKPVYVPLYWCTYANMAKKRASITKWRVNKNDRSITEKPPNLHIKSCFTTRHSKLH